MYDSGKIIAGLLIFAVLFTSPFWYDAVSGSALSRPNMVLPSGPNKKECVAGTAYMRRDHMILLNEWRNEMVREGKNYYVSTTGGVYKIRLTQTCLGCHKNASQFCDRCHSYAGVNPYCWQCHIKTGLKGQGPPAAPTLNSNSETSDRRLAPSRASTSNNARGPRHQTKNSKPS